MSTPLLQANSITKQFGSLTALDNVHLTLHNGEIVGLAGRNGSGITTLFQILAGLLPPDQGFVEFEGKHVPQTVGASLPGIGVIHQRPELAEQLDVTSNIFLGHELVWRPFGQWLSVPNQQKMDETAVKILTTLDAPFISLREKVHNLSAEHRQLVAIARVMTHPNRLLLIDNPNILLSIPYQKKLLQLIRRWQQEKVTVMLSSNNLDHLFAVCDRILVLRQGHLVANKRSDETTREEIVALLVGSDGSTQRTPAIWALDSYYQAREQAEMLRHNQQLLKRDLQAHETLNQELVNKLAEQVKALDRANLALQDANRRLLTKREEERKHLAREIHDQSIQDLLSINYQLEEVADRIEEQNIANDDIIEIRQSIQTLVEDLRRICGNLRPPTIDSLGLGSALRSFTGEWSHRTGIALQLDVDDDFGRLPETLELSIFRIIQEGLNNIWKHANATEARVSLRPTSPRLLLISIADNGKGFDKKFNISTLGGDRHYGLLGISERVALLGGRLRFENQKPGGLLVQVELPHPKIIKSRL